MGEPSSVRVLQALDVAVHGLAVAVVLGTGIIAVTAASGGTPAQARERLFFVGLVALLLGTVATRPRRAEHPARSGGAGGEDDARRDFEGTEAPPSTAQRHLSRLVPDQGPLQSSKQFSKGTWLLVAGVLLQAAAFAPV